MDIEYGLLISLAALVLSLYNFFSASQIRALEKRSEIMAEVSQVQLTSTRTAAVFNELVRLDLRESPELKQSFVKLESRCEEAAKETQELFEIIYDGTNLSSATYEKIRPRAERAAKQAQETYEMAQENLKLAKSIVSKRPKILED